MNIHESQRFGCERRVQPTINHVCNIYLYYYRFIIICLLLLEIIIIMFEHVLSGVIDIYCYYCYHYYYYYYYYYYYDYYVLRIWWGWSLS